MNPSDPVTSTQHRSPASPGRRPITTRDEISTIAIDMFTEAGFENTSVDDIADAAGIARRTLFRYYPSKNAICWGDFDAHLDEMRTLLSEIPAHLPIAQALTDDDLAGTGSRCGRQ